MEFKPSKYSMKVIKEGYETGRDGDVQGGGPVVLLIGKHKVLVGTGLPQDKDIIIKGLEENGVTAEEVDYVVCSHGIVENVGNLNLFPKATHIIGYDIVKGDRRINHQFIQDIPFEIEEDIEIVPTPGLCGTNSGVVTVVVTNTPLGIVAVAGGLFHSEADLETPELWVDESLDSQLQQESRINILRIADHVVPRYGPFFRIPDSFRSSNMSVVLTP